MLSLRDIMTRDVVTLDPEMTLRDALEILASRHISGAPVLEGDRVVGMFSARDAIEFLTAIPGVPDTAGSPDERETAELEEWREQIADASAAYFVDFWSDTGGDIVRRFQDVNTTAWDLLAEHTVSEAMNRSRVVLPPSADVRAAADAMQRAHAHRVLVMEGTRLVGVVSALDIARAVAEHRLESTRYIVAPQRAQLC